MSNPRLTNEQLEQARALLDKIRNQITALSKGNQDLRFAFNRKIAKELGYDERDKPAVRKKLKKKKLISQDGKCAICKKALPQKDNVLDRFDAKEGYTEINTRLICRACDTKTQEERRYS